MEKASAIDKYIDKSKRVFHSVSQFRIRTINLYGKFHTVWQVSPEPMK